MVVFGQGEVFELTTTIPCTNWKAQIAKEERIANRAKLAAAKKMEDDKSACRRSQDFSARMNKLTNSRPNTAKEICPTCEGWGGSYPGKTQKKQTQYRPTTSMQDIIAIKGWPEPPPKTPRRPSTAPGSRKGRVGGGGAQTSRRPRQGERPSRGIERKMRESLLQRENQRHEVALCAIRRGFRS